ncbi:MAG: glycoside hydrolase family 97 N-terminal domain-containing protein, partial [Verrucomicrobiota bacterium]
MLRTADGAESLKSPDGRIELSIQIPEQTADGSPHWSAAFQGKPVLADCQLGIEASNGGDLLKHAKLVRTNRGSVDQRIKVLFGKAEEAPDLYNEIRFTFETTKQQQMDVVFRCYNDALALRYEIADKEPGSTITITDETTSFHLVG